MPPSLELNADINVGLNRHNHVPVRLNQRLSADTLS